MRVPLSARPNWSVSLFFRLTAALLASIAAVAAPAQAMNPAGAPFAEMSRRALEVNPDLPYSPSTIIVRFDPALSEGAKSAIRRTADGPTIRQFSIVPGLEVMGTRLDPVLAISLLNGQP